MSKQATNQIEPNRTGLPDSPERGIGETQAQPAVAGTGKQGAETEEVLAAQQGKPVVKNQKRDPKDNGLAWFRVKGPGSVKVNGSWFGAGAELQMARAEALGVDEYLEEIEKPS